MRVALVHDYLLVYRGAERTFAAMAALWPDAPIFTLLHDPEAVGQGFGGRDVRPSPLQRLGVRQGGFRRLLPLLPLAAARLPVDEYDLVVSSSSAFAHGVRPAPGAVHVCYCHSPFRYAWFERERARREVPAPARPALAGALAAVRAWDLRAARRVTRYVANSRITQQRIAQAYRSEAGVVHPPVEVDRFAVRPDAVEDFVLFVGELVAHKRADVALEAARRAGRPMKVVGTGPERERLEARYGDGAEFLGRVDDEALAALYPRALALVVPNVEEFGIAAVEAQAAGRPVVAVDAGGARETVVDGETGVLVPCGDVDRLTAALRDVDFAGFAPERIRANAERFSTAAFRRRLLDEVDRARGRGGDGDRAG